MFRKLYRNQFFLINKTQFRLQGQRPYNGNRGLRPQIETPSYFKFYQKLQDESSSLFNRMEIETNIKNITLPNIEILEEEINLNLMNKKKKQGLKKRRKKRYGRLIDLQIGKKINQVIKTEDDNDTTGNAESDKKSSNSNKD